MEKDIWDKIRLEYEITDKSFGMLSREFGKNENTIRKRKWEEGWQRVPNPIHYPREKSGGNNNPSNQFKKGNRKAFKHGLFSRHLPAETLEIVKQLEDYDALDFLWDSIKLQYAIILRSHKIMFVEDKDDHNKFVTSQISTEDENGDVNEQLSFDFGWEHHTAQDRHSEFMKSHSRAMGELRSLVKEFFTLADERDIRRQKIELMMKQVEQYDDTDTNQPLRVEVVRKEVDNDE